MKTTRTKLYEMVWAKPVSRLAKEFRLSDVGLAKTCRRHDIPLPERGHWARLAAGQAITKRRLPNPENDEVIEIYERGQIAEEQLVRQREQNEKEKKLIESIGVIEVPLALESPHKLTRMTQKVFEGIIKKIQKWEKVKNSRYPNWEDHPPHAEHGRYSCRATDGYSLTVSLESLDRALRFLDTLVKTLEKNGFKVQNDVEIDRGGKAVEATQDGEGIRFHLSEGYKRRRLTPDELEVVRKESRFASEYETNPSGKFTLTINGRESWSEKKWTETSKPIEDQLPAILAEFIDLVPRQKQIRIDRARAEEERRERERRAWEIQRKREQQQKQFDTAMAETEQLQRLERLEAYLRQLEDQYQERYGAMDANAIAWFKLVRAIAQSKNPIVNRLQGLNGLQEADAADLGWMPGDQQL